MFFTPLFKKKKQDTPPPKPHSHSMHMNTDLPSQTGRVLMPDQKLDRLGAILLRCNMITYEELQRALTVQSRGGAHHKFLGEILIDEKVLTEEDLVSALSRQFKIPYLKINQCSIPRKITKLIPLAKAKQYLAVPINQIGPVLVVAMANPANQEALEELRKITGCQIKIVLSKISEIKEAIEIIYRPPEQTLINKATKPTEEKTSDAESQLSEGETTIHITS